jgi:hypothetical protein
MAGTGHGGDLAQAAAEGPRGGRGSGYGAASSEGEATQRHEVVGAEAVRRGSDARRRTDGWLGSFLRARARARQQATREPAGGRWCGGRAGTTHGSCGQVRRPGGWLRRHAGNACTGAVRSKRVSSCASRSILPAIL